MGEGGGTGVGGRREGLVGGLSAVAATRPVQVDASVRGRLNTCILYTEETRVLLHTTIIITNSSSI